LNAQLEMESLDGARHSHRHVFYILCIVRLTDGIATRWWCT